MSSSNTPTNFVDEVRRDLWGPVLCGAAMATVGTSVVASKLIGMQVEPFAATALRHLLALPVLALLCWLFQACLAPTEPARCAASCCCRRRQAAWATPCC